MKTRRDIRTPSPNEFKRALVGFVITASAIAFLLARKRRLKRFEKISKLVADEFLKRFSEEDARAVVRDFAEGSQTALTILFEEMVYVSVKHRNSVKKAGFQVIELPGETEYRSIKTGNASLNEAVEDLGIVKASIDKLLEKLPKWAQRIIEALMEVLKLSRGLT